MVIMSKKKDRLKPISFYPHKPEDVIAAFLKVDIETVREREKQWKQERKEQNKDK